MSCVAELQALIFKKLEYGVTEYLATGKRACDWRWRRDLSEAPDDIIDIGEFGTYLERA